MIQHGRMLQRSVLDFPGFPAHAAVLESITLPAVLWDFDLTSYFGFGFSRGFDFGFL